MTRLERRTRETQITIELAPPGEAADIDAGSPFLTHMLQTLARYSGLALRVTARGDLRHHLIEDVAIALGELLARLEGPRERYGERTVPMDDALVQVALDLGGRPFYRGRLPNPLYEHWMRSFALHARATLHVRVLRGRDRHHIVEAAFKALGFALRDALAPATEVLSTKGTVAIARDRC
jgi:imidazoleglycerol-phosphate dehydratase